MDNLGTTSNQPGSVSVPVVQKLESNVPVSGKNDFVKTIVIVILSLVTVVFIGLFVWMFMQYNEANADVEEKISKAVTLAKDQQAEELEAEFLEREKEPFNNFAGPEDYGELSFKYPRTWSVYVAADASNGGDFEAYFNPVQVNRISNDTINALRVIIRNKSFESVASDYERYVSSGELSIDTVTINGTTANRYTGTIPGTNLNGIIVIIKIRDKTAILRTDSMLFENDFNGVLNSITFNA